VRRGFQGTTINLPDVSNEFRWPGASVLGPDDFLTRLQDRQHRPAVPTPQLQETYSARSMMPIASCPQEGKRARAERGFAAARQVLRRASRVTAAVAVNRGASHFQLGNLYAGQTE
jgi:hypothetical protein